MRLLICLFFPLLLFALGVKDFHISSDSQKIEIIFLLDSTFKSRVSREYTDSFGAVILKGVHFNHKKVIDSTELIKQVEIFQKSDDLYIVFAQSDFGVKYSVNVLNSNRILKVIVTKNESISSDLISSATATTSSLEGAISAIKSNSDKNNSYITPKSPLELETWRYVAVILVLSSLLVALIITKRKMQAKNDNKEFSYFNKQNKTKENGDNKNLVDIVDNVNTSSIGVSKVINIDSNNKIIVINSRDYKYLMFIGEHSSFLIDRISNDEFNDIDDISFNKILERKEARLPFMLRDYKDEED